MPAISTLQEVVPEKEMNLHSAAVLNHQKHPSGYQTIQAYMQRDFNVPLRFEDYDYVSQLLQAEGLKTAIEAHRRAMPYCMGSLYWQLNDCWPVTSWSSVDYNNNWKAAHYQAMRSFSPQLVSVDAAPEQYNIYVTNDSPDTLQTRIFIQLIDFYGNPLLAKAKDIRVLPNSSGMYYTITKKDLGNFDTTQTLLSASLLPPGKLEQNATYYYFAKPKNLKLNKTKVQIFETTCAEGVQCFTLSSDLMAKNVFVSIKGESVNLSDNFFDLLPGQPKTITLPAGKKIGRLKKKLIIKSLVDTYQQ